MKITFKVLYFSLFFFLSNLLYAETNVAYINLDKIYNESNAGKFILDEIEKINKKNISNFKKNEEILKKEEKEISSQQNILSKEEYEKKVLSFKAKVDKYRSDRNKTINDLKNKRIKALNELSKTVNKILAQYSVEKNLSFVLPKKNIVIGKSELEITNEILTIVDKEIKKVKIN